ncbi:MAG: hypothetical protein LBV51_04980 [Acholeplasmatales bacterium]|jgi:uncharacterized membrane protein|nr:hypothetical protein [Acholeplasmatales bacterium]
MNLIEYEKLLTKTLKKSFYQEEEITEIVSYYIELINERLEKGDNLKDILLDYNPSSISRELAAQTYNKRKVKNTGSGLKAIWKVIVFLLTKPFLIPVGIVYIVLFVVSIVLIVSSVTTIAVGIVYVIYNTIIMIASGIAASEVIGFGALILASFSVATLAILLIQVIIKGIDQLFLKLAEVIVRKKGNKRI